MSKTVYKGEKKEFELHTPEIGRFGGGTQPAKYIKDGKEIPYEKTKWFKLKTRRLYENKGD